MKTVEILKPFLRGTCVILPVAIAFFDGVVYIAKVDGVSMQPVFNPSKTSQDYLVLNRWAVKEFKVLRGDIVSLKSPRKPTERLVKRVIGLEGDVIRTLSYKQRFIRIPKGHCWVEGDNHNQSYDSNHFGPVSLGLITAKATHVVWPLSRFQKLNSSLPKEREPLSRKQCIDIEDNLIS